MKTLKVYSMTSPRTNKPVANQFKIYTPKGVFFQSYQTIIAFKPNEGKLKLDNDYWDYSRTTSKYRNEFTNMNTQETKKAIKDKQITLTNLN